MTNTTEQWKNPPPSGSIPMATTEQWKDPLWVMKALPIVVLPNLIDLKQYWFEQWNFESGDPVAREVYLKICDEIKQYGSSNIKQSAFGESVQIKASFRVGREDLTDE